MLDRTPSERDDYWIYIGSMLLFAVGTFTYLLVKTPLHVYGLQVILGVAYAMNMAALYGIFSRHLDKHLEGSEWSLFSVFSFSVGSALAGAIGGTLAVAYGFHLLFIISGTAYLIGALLTAILLRPHLKGVSGPGAHRAYFLRDHEKSHRHL